MTEKKTRRNELIRAQGELRGIRDQLERAYLFFDRSSDPELTDACIYEINALRARYDHAIRNIKAIQT